MDSVEKSADERPALVWMSISVVEDPKTISRQISEFAHQCHDAGILLSIGGRAVSDLSLDHVPGLGVYGSLAGVAKLANSIASGTSDYEDLAAQV